MGTMAWPAPSLGEPLEAEGDLRSRGMTVLDRIRLKGLLGFLRTLLFCRSTSARFVGRAEPKLQGECDVRYLLTFYAREDEWMALPEAERNAAIGEIAKWFAEHATAGKIVEGHRLGRGVKTVLHGRVRRKDLPMVSDGPFVEAKESVGSYAVVEVSGEDEALEIAKRWPAGGLVEVRPVAE